jgi:hypothetical protein
MFACLVRRLQAAAMQQNQCPTQAALPASRRGRVLIVLLSPNAVAHLRRSAGQHATQYSLCLRRSMGCRPLCPMLGEGLI